MILKTCLEPVRLGALFGVWGAAAAALSAQDHDHLAGLINQGGYDQAQSYLTQREHSDVDLLLFKARVLKSQGDVAAAVPLLREALVLDPASLDVRRELAYSLFVLKKDRQAEYQLNTLLRYDPDPMLRLGYDRLLAQIQQRHPLQFSGYFEFAPSSNASRGSATSHISASHHQLEISDDSRARSDLGYRFGASVIYQKPLSQTLTFTAQLNAGRLFYPAWSDLNETTAGLGFELSKTIGRNQYRFGPNIQRSWMQGDDVTTREGLSAGWSYSAMGPYQLDLRTSWAYKKRPKRPSSNGPEWQISARYTRIPSQRLSWRIGTSYEKVHPRQEPHNRYVGHSLSVGLRYLWKGGVVADFGLLAGIRDFEGAAALMSEVRQDDYLRSSFSVQLTNELIFGLSPVVSCEHLINQSNVALYDYSATDCGVRLTRGF